MSTTNPSNFLRQFAAPSSTCFSPSSSSFTWTGFVITCAAPWEALLRGPWEWITVSVQPRVSEHCAAGAGSALWWRNTRSAAAAAALGGQWGSSWGGISAAMHGRAALWLSKRPIVNLFQRKASLLRVEGSCFHLQKYEVNFLKKIYCYKYAKICNKDVKKKLSC